MVLVEVHEGLFLEHPIVRCDAHGGWRLLTPCHVEQDRRDDELYNADACPLLYGAATAVNDRVLEEFLGLMTEITTKARMQQPWESMTDKKALHHVGSFSVTRATGKIEEFKIWQFEKRRTVVRVLWTYVGGRRGMLLTHMFEKNSDKTPSQQKTKTQDITAAFIQATESGDARLVQEQGGRAGFVEIWGSK